MHSSLAIALFAGLGSMLAWGSADFFAKKTIDQIGDVTTLFWQQLLGVVPLLVAFLVSPHVPHLNHYDPFFLLIFGITTALTYLPLYSGFGKGQISLLSPIFASYSVVVVILSVLILGQTLNGLQILAIIVTFIGILLISTDTKELSLSFKKHAFRVAGVPEVLTAMIGYSFWLLYLDKFLVGKQWLFYLLVIRSISCVTLLIYSLFKRVKLSFKDQTLWKYLLAIGVFDVGAFSFVSYGFSHSHYPSIIAVLSATFSLPTIVLAYIFLKERINRSQILAGVSIISGVILITIA